MSDSGRQTDNQKMEKRSSDRADSNGCLGIQIASFLRLIRTHLISRHLLLHCKILPLALSLDHDNEAEPGRNGSVKVDGKLIFGHRFLLNR